MLVAPAPHTTAAKRHGTVLLSRIHLRLAVAFNATATRSSELKHLASEARRRNPFCGLRVDTAVEELDDAYLPSLVACWAEAESFFEIRFGSTFAAICIAAFVWTLR